MKTPVLVAFVCASLLSAREAEGCDLAEDALRPQLHLTARRGWVNDPNGLVFWRGEWHLFCQYNPADIVWGPMHWNHAVSRDLVHWTELGVALAPDKLGTMFSGSAVIDHGNTAGFGTNAMVLVYTAAGDQVKPARPYVQCLAHSNDGRRFAKYDGNPVLPCVAGGGNRDPRVFWHAPTGRWVMALYGQREGRHAVLVFTSPDLKAWTEESAYLGDEVGNGTWLYECPGLEELRVQGDSETAWVVWGAGDRYAVGSFDGRRFTPKEERISGFAYAEGESPFYAAQTYSDVPDGRVIWVPWFRLPARAGASFRHAFGIPQELSLRHTAQGLRLVRRPVRELKTLRKGEALPPELFDAELAEVRLSAMVGADGRIVVRLRGMELAYDARMAELSVIGRRVPWVCADGCLDLTVYLDRVGLEVFSSDGLQMLPDPTAFPCPADRRIEVVKTEGVTNVSLKAWPLSSIYR